MMMTHPLWALGVTLGGLALIASLMHLPVQLVLTPLPWLWVLGGSVVVTSLGHGFANTLATLGAVFIPAKTHHRYELHPSLMDDLLALCDYARRNGLLALNSQIAALEGTHPFLQLGCHLLAENPSHYDLQEALTTRMEVQFRNQQQQAHLLETMAGYAPTLGLMGALLGLMKSLTDLGTSSSVNPLNSGDLAMAFSCTLIGLALANGWWLPMAQRVRQHASQQWVIESLILQGLLGVHQLEHPLKLEERLSRFMIGANLKPSGASSAAATTPHAHELIGVNGVSLPHPSPTVVFDLVNQGAASHEGIPHLTASLRS